jgi:hypothetical protein
VLPPTSWSKTGKVTSLQRFAIRDLKLGILLSSEMLYRVACYIKYEVSEKEVASFFKAAECVE